MIEILIFLAKLVLILSSCPYDSTGSACNMPKYMVDSYVCADICPTLYTPYQLNCPSCSNYCTKPTGAAAILFILKLASVQDLTLTYVADSSDSTKKFENPGGIQYKSLTHNSPLPTLDRGFYFATSSGMIGNQSYIPGPYFILNLVIKTLGSGEILNVKISSTSYIRIWADPSGVYYFSVLIYNSNGTQQSVSGASAVNYSSSWHTVSMYLYQWNCNTCSIVFYYNGNTQGATHFLANEIRFPNGVYTWTFGNTSGGNSFRGFIYWLSVWAETSAVYFQTTTIDCADNYYWDGSACHICRTGCPTWPWCVRGGDCSYCYLTDCSACDGYSFSMCTACYTGIPPGCCDHLGATCTQTWSNTACTNGYFLIGGVCLYGCPYGYGNCAAVSSAVITADFTGTFAGNYGSAWITGTSSASYNYWNSPETSDPFPAKNRGLYFNSNQFLAGSINLSHTWSMGLWVYAIFGTIISHSSNRLSINSSGTINFDLEKWDGTYASYSASKSITLNTWSYISYSVGFVNKATTLTPYINNISGSSATATNYVFRLADGGTLYIGSPNFNGFISYFQLWGITITDFSVPYSLYVSAGTTLWPCDYSNYYDGSACQPCSSSGSCSMGCTRGTSCYICDDFLCSKCSSFGSGACTACISNASGTPCTCNTGFYQPINQALCSACTTGCNSCTGSTYYLCTSCSSSYFFYNSMLCISNCPSGYTENSGTRSCIFSSNSGLSLSLYDKIILHMISGTKIGNSMGTYYPTYDVNDPYPAYLRGYYFTGTTYMSSSTVIGPYFTVSIWIYPIGAGTVVAKTVSGNEIFCLEILSGSGYPKLSLILKDSSSFSVTLSENSLTSSWKFIAFTGKIDASYTTKINSYFNSLTKEVGSSSNIIYFQDRNANTLYIGTKSTISSGFIGFLYDLNIYNIDNLQYNDYTTSGCILPCTSCPSDHNCPNTCPISQFYDGSACTNCGSCPKGCRYTDACRLCKTKQCLECSNFAGACSSCIANAKGDGSAGCRCKANTFWVSSTATCDFCDALCSACKQTTYFECTTCIAGKQIVDSICLNDCPYGYGTSCSLVSTAVIDQLFDIDFQGSYGIFTTGTDPTSFQPFISPETIDPVPAYKRGLYFDGNMYLLSSASVYLSHSFAMGTWVYAVTNGDLLQKQTRLTVASTGAITAIMEGTTQTTSAQTLSPSSSFTGWTYVSISIYYTSNASVLSLYINAAAAGSVTISGKIFRDQTSTNLLLGKSSSSGFVGFIYSFQLWNIQITGFPAIINGFAFCGSGSGASCLWECLISTYKNSASCSACNSCSKGCVRANTCNICDDLLCAICSGFGSGKCIQCVNNANGTPCVCDPGYRTSNDGFSCQPCYTGCSQCTDSTYQKCIACFSGYLFFAPTGQCLTECPSGYSPNSAGKTCDYSTYIGIGLDLTDQIRLDTVSGFNVGALNTNSYPDWNLDTKDPIPSYKRGYYFFKSNYLSSTVIISPSFAITMWTKSLTAGILMTKYTSSDIIKISVDSSGYPLLSLKFVDSSSATLTASTYIINNWSFLSFTGEIETNGKTKLTLYLNTASVNSFTTSSLIYFKDTNAGILYIGNDETFGTSGLYGFLAGVNIYNSYNHQADDYSTSCGAGCSTCPGNNQCLSICAVNEYPDSCDTCLLGCNEGCVSDLTCRLCRDKECYSCTTFTGECISCIANAYKPVDHCMCNTNAVWVSSSQSCELCNTICDTCSTVEYTGCLTCITGYYLI